MGAVLPINRVVPLQPQPGPSPAENTRGLIYMALAVFIFSAVDTQAKFLGETLHPIQIVWTRQSGLLIGVLVLLVMRGPGFLKTPNPVLQISRGVLAMSSATLFIVGIHYVPLADAVAVTFVAPFVVTILGALVLREPVGIRRWSAVAVGFVGTLIVIRPGTGVMHPAVFLILTAATAFALRQILSRILSGADGTLTTVAYTSLTASLLLTIPLPFVWQWPQSSLEIVLMVSIAIMAAFGEILVIRALEMAQAVVVAPVQYTQIIWGTVYGYLVFGNFPDRWTWVGAAIIVATGLYIFHREQRVGRRSR